MSDEIGDLSNEELVQEYRETVEFRIEESIQGQVSPKEIKLRKALEEEIVERMASTVNSEKTDTVYNYVQENPDSTISEVLEATGKVGETVDALHYLRQKGEIYEPQQGQLRVTEE